MKGHAHLLACALLRVLYTYLYNIFHPLSLFYLYDLYDECGQKMSRTNHLTSCEGELICRILVSTQMQFMRCDRAIARALTSGSDAPHAPSPKIQSHLPPEPAIRLTETAYRCSMGVLREQGYSDRITVDGIPTVM